MSGLWNPNKDTRAALSRGDRKIRLDYMKKTGSIIATECPFCGSPVYSTIPAERFFTLGGSVHKCKGLRERSRNEQAKMQTIW